MSSNDWGMLSHVFLVLSALGEVASFSREPITLHTQAKRFCGPSLGFTLGWIYWLKYMMVIINQITAGVLVLSFWTNLGIGQKAAYITVFLAVILSMNYWSGRFLGRYEVLLSSFKILVVLGLMMLSLVIALGGGPNHKKGFHYWRMPGAFANEEDRSALGVFRAIFRTFPPTTLSYLGTELIGMAVLHTQDSKKAAARAIQQTFYRILAFNLVVVTLLGMAIPYDEDILELSIYTSKRRAMAFVVAVQVAHVTVLPDILNACILIFVVSSASRALCMATRIIRELSLEENAPHFLRRVNKRGVPVYALGGKGAMEESNHSGMVDMRRRHWHSDGDRARNPAGLTSSICPSIEYRLRMERGNARSNNSCNIDGHTVMWAWDPGKQHTDTKHSMKASILTDCIACIYIYVEESERSFVGKALATNAQCGLIERAHSHCFMFPL
ncbi:hypothetical protein AN8816.2 [Aspergillus nidulans FGSC A4]|uniref:Amino acid transporter (Eurofung) n=1 Tax=Emericella nidulans (strain FGSC A4 / ATCC 38163 / CBS 112.46 / NRRL 194 / M139) TaxID=227321 RepID=Q5ASB4_EMENI|nr:hypothetical protein [Aspergillus nidulans FGSC A4]EAA60609.1 hypothetical protein AN8816.2 [Aspergillus nidulans FGSC A4]CBF77962.1 TPA: amino acid transporter (Eurofung) [Aspergillus nidulans FGSC A4]|eukprot:XP_682085.1 hypothetical protein AN8816.2 [Aspergillus nidulans FGSC A4]